MSTWQGGTGNYSLNTNWSGSVLPSPTEDAVFDGSVSNVSCTINTSPLRCLRFRVINGYTGTITFTNNLFVYGNYEVDAASATSWTFSAATTAGLLFVANASIDIPVTRVTSNIGIETFVAGSNITITLVRDTTIANYIGNRNGPNVAVTFAINRASIGNGDNLFVTNNFINGGSGFGQIVFTGTTTLNFISTTASTLNIAGQGVRNNVIINGSGTYTGPLTLSTGSVCTYLNGNVTGVGLIFYNSSTIVSNGAVWGNVNFSAFNGQTLTVTTDLICGGTFFAFNSFFWNISHTAGSVIRVRGGGTHNLNVANADIIIESIVNCSFTLSNQNTNLDLVLNPFAGSQITWLNQGAFYGTSTLTYLTSNGGPTPIATAYTLINYGTLTINTSPSLSNYIIFAGFYSVVNGTLIILLSNLHINGPLNLPVINTGFNGVGFSVICGGCTNPSPANTLGTANIQLGYTGTWNAGLLIGNDLIISPLAGQTVTIQAITKSVTNKSITYTAGAGTLNSSASALTIPSFINVPMSTSGMTWGSITVGTISTLTLNQALNISGTLLCNGDATFAGTAGWTCASLVMTAAGTFIMTLKNGVTYTTTTAVQLTGATNTNRYTMISDNVSFRAIWTVGNTATQAITYVDGTRIDSSAGATVWTLGAVSTTAPDTRNWNNGSQPSTVGYTFVN